MARDRTDPVIHWVCPPVRGVLPLTGFHVPRRLRKTLRSGRFEVRCNQAFERVIGLCAESAKGRRETWINAEIIGSYTQLHHLGHAHSVESWRDGELVGGLYGVALGRAFFGESMVSRETDASKVALVHLVARLRLGGFSLLDVQFVTDHLRRFGAVEISAAAYLRCLDRALDGSATFYSELSTGDSRSAVEALLTQSRTQMS